MTIYETITQCLDKTYQQGKTDGVNASIRIVKDFFKECIDKGVDVDIVLEFNKELCKRLGAINE